MRRRDFLAALGLLPFVPFECARRQRRALVLATADTESHVAVLDAASGHVRARVATVEGPRSIEAAGGSRAVVAHTEVGAISLLEGPPTRVRRVLRGVSEPRYTAVAPGGRLAYVTDSARGEVAVIDLELGRLAGGAEVGRPGAPPDDRARRPHALGRARQDRRRRGDRRRLRAAPAPHPPTAAPSLPGPRLGLLARRTPAVDQLGRPRAARHSDAPGGFEPIAVLPAGAPPQHVSFGGGRAYVASGDDGVPEGAEGGRRGGRSDEPAWPEAPTTSSTARVAW